MREIEDGDERQLVGEHIIGEMRQGAITGHDPIGSLRFCRIGELGRTKEFDRQHISRLETILQNSSERLIQRYPFAISSAGIFLRELLEVRLRTIGCGPQRLGLLHAARGIRIIHLHRSLIGAGTGG